MIDFIGTLAPFAIRHGMARNILPSLIIAQGILETGGGTSTLAKEANNLFGIKKGTGWDGPVYSVVTSEYRKNAAGEDELYYITAEFRKYDSYEGSVKDLCAKYNDMPRYAAVPGESDFNTVVHAVKAAGYATDPNYPAKLINIYNTYNLGQYDIGFTETIKEDTEMAFKVVFDAGHGKNTPGKRTPAGEREWTFNNVVVLAAIKELQRYANVDILRVDDPTGNTDVSLASRTAKANSWKGSVYVSVHHNANTGVWGTWTGTETFVYSSTVSTDGSWKLAQAVHPRLVAAMGLRDRGIKKANFHVLRETRMPAILTEGGYMDSTIDIKKMRNNSVLQAAGRAIAQGIVAYAGLKLKATAPKPTPVSNPNLYRVRKSWADADSQKGAFAELDGAISVAKANAGYKVFDHNGKQVYPEAVVATPAPSDNLYRVRKLWSDPDSQIGAYSDLDGAKAIADANITYNVYDSKGNVVYDPRKARDERLAAEKAAAEAAAKKAAEEKAKAEAAAKAKAEAEAKAKAEADAKAAADRLAKLIAEGLLATLEVAIVMNSERDYEAARKIHVATGYPMFERAGLHNRKVAKHIIGVGGTAEELIDNNADKVTMVAGKTQADTLAAAEAFVKAL